MGIAMARARAHRALIDAILRYSTGRMRETLERLVELSLRGQDEAIEAVLGSLGERSLTRLESMAASARAALPLPISASIRDRDAQRSRALDHVLGWIAMGRGEPERLLASARQRWLSGGGHPRYLRLLVRFGRADDALVLARSLLEDPGCADALELEQVLAEAAAAPAGWTDAVRQLVCEPTLDRWEKLMRFTPPEARSRRVRYTQRMLLQMGVDPERVFDFVTSDGSSADAVDLANLGLVNPSYIVERGRSIPEVDEALWLGLAARSACVRGEHFATLRYLRQALAELPQSSVLADDVDFVYSRAGAELLEMLDRAGIERPELV